VNPSVDPLLVVVVLINFLVLGASRLKTVIQVVAVQGIVLGGLAIVVHGGIGFRVGLLAAAAILLKGAVIPAMLEKAMRDVAIKREVEPYVGFIPSLFLGAVATAVSLLFAGTLPLVPEHAGSMMVPVAFATVLTGFIVLTTRRKAITQVVGYLLLENGIFIFGLLLVEAMPFLVELGVLLDLFAGIFVLGIIVNHISRTFDSMDTGHLTALKD
jgi:hydrogenase-4 component E